MILMAGHKPWSGIKTKMTPEMRINAIAKAESLVQEILTQKTDKEDSSLSEELYRPVEICPEEEAQACVH